MVAAVVAVVDITAQKDAEERLRAAGQFRETFLGVLSHDLRNMVGIITATARLVLAMGRLDDRGSEMVSRISATAERMARMIRDLLDFTRGRLGGGLPVVPKPSDLAVITAQVVEELRAAYPHREFRLTMAGDLRGEWDADRLAQALMNLCKNAVDYGRPSSAIEVAAFPEHDTVLLEVKNEGEAIPPEQLEVIFEPYRRASSRRMSTGLVLGLFIVREVARAHGGSAEARVENAHVVFTMRLPRQPSRSSPVS